MPVYHDLMSNDYIELARSFKVNPKHCNNSEHYQNYICQDSILDHKQGMGVTHVFVDENEKMGEKKIAGYVTLRSSSLIMDTIEKYKLGYPALEISELAVDSNYERQNLGTDMVKFAINEATELNEEKVGVQYVILCADPKSVGFYANNNLGFEKLPAYKQIPREYRNKDCIPMVLKVANM